MHLPYSRHRPEDDGTTMANEVVVGGMMDDGMTMATMMPDYGDDDEPRLFHRRHRHPLFICEEREEMRTMN